MSERYRRGVEILHQLTGESAEYLTSRVAEIAPDFARMTIEFPFGDLYARGTLGLREREIAAIGALAARSNAAPQLRVHVAAALTSIGEIHLAGYRPDPIHGAGLLIDSHDSPVSEQVWALYCHGLRRFGAIPTLIERDGAIPAFNALMAERNRAASLMRIGGKVTAHV